MLSHAWLIRQYPISLLTPIIPYKSAALSFSDVSSLLLTNQGQFKQKKDQPTDSEKWERDETADSYGSIDNHLNHESFGNFSKYQIHKTYI